ncbi:MAG TPA: glycoside hydrolase family 16 protein [Bdellovibrionota bacterium]|jgi:licheninase
MPSVLIVLFLLLSPVSQARNLCEETLIRAGVKKVLEVNAKSDPSLTPCVEEMNKVAKWELVWGDDFKYQGKPDPKLWKYETGGWGWFNNELQNYTDRIENSYSDNGKLVIKAIHEKSVDKDNNHNTFTSAKLNSQEHFVYGRYEFRARIPIQNGTWPAAWLFPEKHIYGKNFWPDNGEIDVMEAVGHMPCTIGKAAHSDFYRVEYNNQRTTRQKVDDCDTNFHTYAVEWYPSHLDFYIDDKKVQTVKREEGWQKWPFDQEFHIKLNLAVGGNWGGAKGVDEAAFPAQLEFEHVKVFRPTNPEDCKL